MRVIKYQENRKPLWWSRKYCRQRGKKKQTTL